MHRVNGSASNKRGIGLSLADSSGLILAARDGEHTDELIEQLVMSTEGKTDCKQFNSDDWGGYESATLTGFGRIVVSNHPLHNEQD